MSDQDLEVHPQRLVIDRPATGLGADVGLQGHGGHGGHGGHDPDDEADDEPLLLDFESARRLLGISKSTLYRLAPRIPGSMKLGGTWRFNRQMLLDFIGCKGPGSPPKKKR